MCLKKVADLFVGYQSVSWVNHITTGRHCFLDVHLQLLSLRPSVRTGSAVLMSSVVSATLGNPAASVGPFLPPSTDQRALLVSQL